MKKYFNLIIVSVLFLTCNTHPFLQRMILSTFSFPDLNIIQVGDRAYAFGGTDLDPFNIENKEFIIPYWSLFSSTDLFHWEFERMLNPKDFYMSESTKCFAWHGANRNGKWYWYFSNFTKNTGVAVIDSPKGPCINPVGGPISDNIGEFLFQDDDDKMYYL